MIRFSTTMSEIEPHMKLLPKKTRGCSEEARRNRQLAAYMHEAITATGRGRKMGKGGDSHKAEVSNAAYFQQTNKN